MNRGPMNEMEQPLWKAAQGHLFVPQEETQIPERKKWLWIALDIAIAVGFLLGAVLLLSL